MTQKDTSRIRLFSLLPLIVPGILLAQRPVAGPQRSLFGDIAVEVRPDSNGLIRVGLADSTQSIELGFLERDFRRWADSAARILRLPPRRKTIVWTTHIDEAGIAAGSMTLTRRDSGGRSRYSLFASDKAFVETRAPLTPQDARALVQLVRKVLKPQAAPSRRRQRRD